MKHIKPYYLFEQVKSEPVLCLTEKSRSISFGYDDIIEEDVYDSLFDAIYDALNSDRTKGDSINMRAFYYVKDYSKLRYGLDQTDIDIINLENEYREMERAESGYDDDYEYYIEDFDPYDEDDKINQVPVSKDPMKTYLGPATPPNTIGAELLFFYFPSEGISPEKILNLPLSEEEKETLVKKIKTDTVRKRLF